MKRRPIKWKTALSAATALTMLLGLTACGTENKNSSADASADAGEASTVVQRRVSESDGPLEPYDEPVTIRVGRTINSDFIYYGGEDVDNNTWTKLYKDKLNITIDNMWVVDQSQESTKMNAAIASGEYPDIFTVNTSDYSKYASTGVIADVTDLYDSYLSDMGRAALASDDEYALNAASIDGKLYGIPRVDSPALMFLFVRQDWLDNLGLDVPKTIEEFTAVAEAFTNGDPDQNGQDDTYALALDGVDISNWWGGVEPFFEMFNAYPLAYNYETNLSLIDDGTGRLQWGGDTDRMQEALALLHDFYNKGYVAQDFGTHDYTKAMADISTGKAGMFFAPDFGAMTIATDFQTNIFTGLLPKNASITATPLPGEKDFGKTFMPSSFSQIAVVSAKCEHPEALFKLYNIGMEMCAYQDDQELFNMYNGDGINYSGWKLAVIDPLKPMKNYDTYRKVSEAVYGDGDVKNLNAEQVLTYDSIMNTYLGIDTVTEENLAQYAVGYGNWHVFANPVGGYAAADQVYRTEAYTSAGYGAGATETMAAKSATLTDHIKTSIIKIAYGEETPESWAKVIENWHTLGGNDVLHDANAWYQRNE